MKCKICGGELKLVQWVYVCESCGSKSEISLDIDSTEVFLMYPESDAQGRRSRESIIAQEIYNKLNQVNISVFYRRNVDSISGEEKTQMVDHAYSRAKIVIIIGTNPEAFNQSIDSQKVVLPVYADVDVYKLPTEIQKLQALNFNSIGAANDLVKNVLAVLGREESISIVSDAEKRRKQRRKTTVILAASVILAAVISVLCFVFFTPYVLPENQYKYAQKLADENKYLEAIDWYNKNPGYKNTKDLLKKLYDNYDGDYISTDKKTMLSLNVLNSTSADVAFSQNMDGRKIKFSASTALNENVIDFQFKDNNSMVGTGKIELLNNGVRFALVYTDDNSYNYSQEFTFEQKGDANEHDSGMREELIGLFISGTHFGNDDCLVPTRGFLEEIGYNTNNWDEQLDEEMKALDYATKDSYESETIYLPAGRLGTSYRADYNYLKNYHHEGTNYSKDAEKNIIFEFETGGNYPDNNALLSVFAKASLLTPDKIGEKPVDFTENGVVFSFVNPKNVLGKDDWVNITAENEDHLKEYNKRMAAIKRINNTDFSDYESVSKLDGENITLNDFMLSNHKLEYSHMVSRDNGITQNVYSIIGTDVLVKFDYNQVGEKYEDICVIYKNTSPLKTAQEDNSYEEDFDY